MNKVKFKWRSVAAVAACLAVTIFASCDNEEEPGIDPNQDPNSGVLTIQNKPAGGITVQVYDFTGAPADMEDLMLIYAAHMNADKVIAVGNSSTSPVELVSLSNGKRFADNGRHAILIVYSVPEGVEADDDYFFFQVEFTNGCATIDWNKAFDIAGSGDGGGDGSGDDVSEFTISGYSGVDGDLIMASTVADATSFVNAAMGRAGMGVIDGEGKVAWAPAPPTGNYTLYLIDEDNENDDSQLLKRTSSPVTITDGNGTVSYSAFVDIVIDGGEFTESDIVGTWEYIYGGFAIRVYEFYADNTGLFYVPIPIIGGREDETPFTWNIADGQITTSLNENFVYVNSTKIMSLENDLEYIKKGN